MSKQHSPKLDFKLKSTRYSLTLLKALAVLAALPGAVTAPLGLVFLTCIRVDQDAVPLSHLRQSDYCSESVGRFLIFTTAELLYLGMLTEFHIIPQWIGFISIGIMGAIALTYLFGSL